MGGGQLGRMFVQAAQAMGYFTAVLDPDPASPAGLVSHYHIQTAYLDQHGLAQLMQRCAAITTEFENVPAPALLTLGSARPVAPAAEAVAIAQDRAREKAHFVRCGVPCAPYAVIETAAQLAAILSDQPSAAPGRPKQASAPSGLSPSAPDVPAHIGTGRRDSASGSGMSSVVHVVTSVGVSYLKVPYKPVLNLTESSLHGTVFLRHLETTQARQPRFFEQAHDGRGAGLGHHVGQGI